MKAFRMKHPWPVSRYGQVICMDRLRKTMKKFWLYFVSQLDLDQALIKCVLAALPL